MGEKGKSKKEKAKPNIKIKYIINYFFKMNILIYFYLNLEYLFELGKWVGSVGKVGRYLSQLLIKTNQINVQFCASLCV